MGDFLSPAGWGLALLQTLLFLFGAPLLLGWISQLKSRLQNRRGPGLLQPYRDLRKLLRQQVQ